MQKIKKIAVLGGGSAGLLAGLTISRKHPDLEVVHVCSSKLGTIGVGEGTSFSVPNFLHSYLGIDFQKFCQALSPTFKLGIRFDWGANPTFYYSFTRQMTQKFDGFSLPNGFLAAKSKLGYSNLEAALMHNNKICVDDPSGRIPANFGYHIKNNLWLSYLAKLLDQEKVTQLDDLVTDLKIDDGRVTHLKLGSGACIEVDFIIDCTGSKYSLLPRFFDTKFVSYANKLFCDSAVVLPIERKFEEIPPYTTVSTLPSGWLWRTEHQHEIAFGYVFSSQFVSSDQAIETLKRQVCNDQSNEPIQLKFKSQRLSKSWVSNILAVGNSSGFVEPMEATSLAMICDQLFSFSQILKDTCYRPNPSHIEMYNFFVANTWDAVADFIALHYKFNDELNTDFWNFVRSETKLDEGQKIVDFFSENGPSLIWNRPLSQIYNGFDPFQYEGYLAMLVGMGVPFNSVTNHISRQEESKWKSWIIALNNMAKNGLSVEYALEAIKRGEITTEFSYPRT